MPGPKRHSKLTGDIHPPEVEEDLREAPDDEPGGTAAERESRTEPGAGDAGRPGRDENAAGFLKDNALGGRAGSER
jgi:hypothetical protein